MTGEFRVTEVADGCSAILAVAAGAAASVPGRPRSAPSEGAVRPGVSALARPGNGAVAGGAVAGGAVAGGVGGGAGRGGVAGGVVGGGGAGGLPFKGAGLGARGWARAGLGHRDGRGLALGAARFGAEARPAGEAAPVPEKLSDDPAEDAVLS